MKLSSMPTCSGRRSGMAVKVPEIHARFEFELHRTDFA